MFQSSGYFKAVTCPYYVSGLCERPYCHFRHVKPTHDEKLSSSFWSSTVTTPSTSSDSSSSLLAKVGETIQKLQRDIERDQQLLNGHKNLKPKSIEAFAGNVAEKYRSRITLSDARKVDPTDDGTVELSYKPTPISELKKKRLEKYVVDSDSDSKHETDKGQVDEEYEPEPKKARLHSYEEEPMGKFSEGDTSQGSDEEPGALFFGTKKALEEKVESKTVDTAVPGDILSQIMQDSSKSLNLTSVKHKKDGSMVILEKKKVQRKVSRKTKPEKMLETAADLCPEMSEEEMVADVLEEAPGIPVKEEVVNEVKKEKPNAADMEALKKRESVWDMINSGAIVLGHIPTKEEKQAKVEEKKRIEQTKERKGEKKESINEGKTDKSHAKKDSKERHSKSSDKRVKKHESTGKSGHKHSNKDKPLLAVEDGTKLEKQVNVSKSESQVAVEDSGKREDIAKDDDGTEPEISESSDSSDSTSSDTDQKTKRKRSKKYKKRKKRKHRHKKKKKRRRKHRKHTESESDCSSVSDNENSKSHAHERKKKRKRKRYSSSSSSDSDSDKSLPRTDVDEGKLVLISKEQDGEAKMEVAIGRDLAAEKDKLDEKSKNVEVKLVPSKKEVKDVKSDKIKSEEISSKRESVKERPQTNDEKDEVSHVKKRDHEKSKTSELKKEKSSARDKKSGKVKGEFDLFASFDADVTMNSSQESEASQKSSKISGTLKRKRGYSLDQKSKDLIVDLTKCISEEETDFPNFTKMLQKSASASSPRQVKAENSVEKLTEKAGSSTEQKPKPELKHSESRHSSSSKRSESGSRRMSRDFIVDLTKSISEEETDFPNFTKMLQKSASASSPRQVRAENSVEKLTEKAGSSTEQKPKLELKHSESRHSSSLKKSESGTRRMSTDSIRKDRSVDGKTDHRKDRSKLDRGSSGDKKSDPKSSSGKEKRVEMVHSSDRSGLTNSVHKSSDHSKIVDINKSFSKHSSSHKLVSKSNSHPGSLPGSNRHHQTKIEHAEAVKFVSELSKSKMKQYSEKRVREKVHERRHSEVKNPTEGASSSLEISRDKVGQRSRNVSTDSRWRKSPEKAALASLFGDESSDDDVVLLGLENKDPKPSTSSASQPTFPSPVYVGPSKSRESTALNVERDLTEDVDWDDDLFETDNGSEKMEENRYQFPKKRVAHADAAVCRAPARRVMSRSKKTFLLSPEEQMHNRYKPQPVAASSTPRHDQSDSESLNAPTKVRIAHTAKWRKSESTDSTPAQTSKSGKREAHVPKKEILARPIIPSEFGSRVPTNIRQRYLNQLIDECLKIYRDEQAAFDRALNEEKAIYERSTSRNVYLNVAVKAIRALRAEFAIEDESSSAGQTRQGRKWSHEAVLGGAKAAKTTFTLHRSGHGIKSPNEVDLTLGVFSQYLQQYILNDDQLKENGFPLIDPDKPDFVKFCGGIDANPAKGLKLHEKVCCRCGKRFRIYPDGTYGTKEECSYHWGRAYKRKVSGQWDSRYNCCSGDLSSEPCCSAKLHVHDSNKLTDLEGYVRTFARPPMPEGHGVYALDCEMVYTVVGCELARVTVIDMDLEPVYETLVKPSSEVIDYNTRFSGLDEGSLDKVRTTLPDVQNKLRRLFSEKTILMGHSLESDFTAMKLIHPTVVDTSVVFPHRLGPPYKRALKNLMGEILKKIIQNDVGGHDSREDAAACMELMIWKVKEELRVKH